MNAIPAHSPNLSAARFGTYTVFFICGFLLAAWVSRIPAIKAHLELDTGELGLILLGGPAGLVTAMPLTGAAIARFGSRSAVTVASLGCALALPLLGLAPTGWLLALALFVFGFFNAAMDISMNAQAVEVEKRYARPIMSSFHALFSLGGLIGAALGGAAAAVGMGPLPFFALITLASVLSLAFALRPLLVTPPRPEWPAVRVAQGHTARIGVNCVLHGAG